MTHHGGRENQPFPVATGPIDDKRNQPKNPGFGDRKIVLPDDKLLDEVLSRYEAALTDMDARLASLEQAVEQCFGDAA